MNTESSDLGIVDKIGPVPVLTDDQKRRAGLHASAWCETHTEDPASALREILAMLGLSPPNQRT